MTDSIKLELSSDNSNFENYNSLTNFTEQLNPNFTNNFNENSSNHLNNLPNDFQPTSSSKIYQNLTTATPISSQNSLKNSNFFASFNEQLQGQPCTLDYDDKLPNPNTYLPLNSKNSVDSKKLKNCNCNKSQCLKLYCECFSRGTFCNENCSCNSCHNLYKYEEERQKSIQNCLCRNPDAFKPKTDTGISFSSTGKPLFLIDKNGIKRGCHCKRSSCLKNYCDCYRAGVFCNEACFCKSCKNFNPEDTENVQIKSNSRKRSRSEKSSSKHASTSPLLTFKNNFDNKTHSVSAYNLSEISKITDLPSKYRKIPGLPPFKDFIFNHSNYFSSLTEKNNKSFENLKSPESSKLFAGLDLGNMPYYDKNLESSEKESKGVQNPAIRLLSRRSTTEALIHTLVSRSLYYDNDIDQVNAIFEEFGYGINEILDQYQETR